MYSLLLSTLALAISVGATPVPLEERNDGNRAAYFLDNNPAGSSIISLKISVDTGFLSDPIRIPTGGIGAFGHGANGDAGPDSLFSQDSVVLDQNYLFTVNAGSNTLSMFFVDENDPWHPKLLGTPANTLGEFPQSVAYSSKLKTACVLNGGAIAGVTCFDTDHAKGLTVLDKTIRTISINQTTPPLGPAGTVSDILFNPSSTALFVTVKGTPPGLGTYYIWPVVDGKVSETPIIRQVNDMRVIFGSTFLGSDSELLVTDPSFGASILHVTPSFDLVETAHTAVPGQGAICWGTFGPRFNSGYLFDAAKTNITVLDPVSGAIKNTIVLDPSVLGSFDNAIDRTWLYVLAGGQSVAVIDLEGSNSKKTPTQVQQFDLRALGSRKGFMGFAIYPSSK